MSVDRNEIMGSGPVLAPTRSAELAMASYGGDAPSRSKDEAEGETPNDDTFIELVRDAQRQGTTVISTQARADWDRALRAFRSEHPETSKYCNSRFKNRSTLFRPKTRSAVMRDLATTGSTLFANRDALVVAAADETDKFQKANASLMKELVSYRLDRNIGKQGIPWFLVALGARQDSVIMGICASKQSWRYRTKTKTVVSQVEEAANEPIIHPVTNEPMIGDDGIPVMDMTPKLVEKKEKVLRILEDRPYVELFPIENLIFSPSSDWTDVAQSSPYLIARYAVPIGDVLQMMKTEQKNDADSAFKWRAVTSEEIYANSTRAMETEGVRRARDGGKDRMTDTQASGGKKNEWTIIWLHENFVRYGGEEWHFWSIGESLIISDPIPLEDAYPEQMGDRPIVIGVGTIEAHNVYPTSQVNSWQSLQAEINDVVNLRLDNLKQNMSPLNKVKRGKNVDIKQLMNRSVDNIVYVDDIEDVTFDRPPDVTRSAYAEMTNLNSDFDDLAGVFNSGSVMTNRSLNETVGGMNLLNGAANATAEFNTRIWSETWLERVLSQLVNLERYYEDDSTVLAVCGQRAQLLERHGVDIVDRKLMDQNVRVSANIGLGSADPMQRFQKLSMAIQLAGQVVQGLPLIQQVGGQADPEALFDEIFGLAGYNDGGTRFVKFQPGAGVPAPPPDMEGDPAAAVDPALGQAEIMRAQAEGEQGQAKLMLDARNSEADRQAELQKIDRQGMFDLIKEKMRLDGQSRRDERKDAKDRYNKVVDGMQGAPSYVNDHNGFAGWGR